MTPQLVTNKSTVVSLDPKRLPTPVQIDTASLKQLDLWTSRHVMASYYAQTWWKPSTDRNYLARFAQRANEVWGKAWADRVHFGLQAYQVYEPVHVFTADTGDILRVMLKAACRCQQQGGG